MLDEVGKGLDNDSYAKSNPPKKALGKAMLDRWDYVQNARKQAGELITEQVDKMRFVPVDRDSLISGPIDALESALSNAKIFPPG